jgi:excinuclease ABC subunit C
VEIITNPGGERRVWVTMATQNTVLAIRQKLAQKATQEERLAALQDALGLASTAQRIECFDVSHTMGEAAVASCVIFDKLAMRTASTGASTSRPPTRATTMRRCARR